MNLSHEIQIVVENFTENVSIEKLVQIKRLLKIIKSVNIFALPDIYYSEHKHSSSCYIIALAVIT